MTGSGRPGVGLSGVDFSVDDLIRLRFRDQRLELGVARRARRTMVGAHGSPGHHGDIEGRGEGMGQVRMEAKGVFVDLPAEIDDGDGEIKRGSKVVVLAYAGGKLAMFEHTGSRVFPFNVMLNLMNPVARHIGPEINRDTVSNVRAAGFEITRVTNIFLDVVKTIEATAPE